MTHSYEIIYLDLNNTRCVGEGCGTNQEAAIKDFLFWHQDVNSIQKVNLYK